MAIEAFGGSNRVMAWVTHMTDHRPQKDVKVFFLENQENKKNKDEVPFTSETNDEGKK